MKLENITKNFIKNGKKIEVLKNLNMKFEKGKMYLIKGRSGCGKSTLINILGLIDSFDSGKYTLDDKIMNNLNDNNLTQLRKEKIGMIFQNHYLDPRLTAKENIKIATFLNNLTEEENELNMQKLFQSFNLEDRINHYPKELSGGEQARFATIRAIINNPEYILADEPAGNLDNGNAIQLYKILKKFTEENKCVIVVSHDDLASSFADVIYELKDGNLVEKI